MIPAKCTQAAIVLVLLSAALTVFSFLPPVAATLLGMINLVAVSGMFWYYLQMQAARLALVQREAARAVGSSEAQMEEQGQSADAEGCVQQKSRGRRSQTPRPSH